MNGFIKKFCVAVLTFIMLNSAWTLDVSGIFNNNMVLQRDVKIPVWGTSTPNSQVTVSFAEQNVSATADAAGKWKAVLNAMPAGGPFKLKVTDESGSVTFNNVLVGEVWICSGQSNMEWWVANSDGAEEEIKNADYPGLRLFFADRKILTDPAESISGKWYVCTPLYVPKFSGVGYYFGKNLHKALNVPVGLINVSRGGTPISAWMSTQSLESDPDFANILKNYQEALKTYPEKKRLYEEKYKQFQEKYANYTEFKKAVAKAKKAGEKVPVKPYPPYLAPQGLWQPSGCYNAYIHPLAPFALRGVIWYQGENDVKISFLYRKLLPAMIKGWRNLWHQPDLQFIIVQLPNYGKTFAECRENQWAEMREAQYLTSKSVPDTGIAVTIDIGGAEKLHPGNKRDVGKRLALWALANTYKKDIPFAGPIYKSFRKDGDKIIITFDQTDLVARNGEKLNAFQIAGSDKKFVWANARLENNAVVVWSPEVKDPAAVRYAWEYAPEVNLYNKNGLPAMPFRTDNWPGMTFDKR